MRALAAGEALNAQEKEILRVLANQGRYCVSDLWRIRLRLQNLRDSCKDVEHPEIAKIVSKLEQAIEVVGASQNYYKELFQ